jgi:hypothetical protein
MTVQSSLRPQAAGRSGVKQKRPVDNQMSEEEVMPMAVLTTSRTPES